MIQGGQMISLVLQLLAHREKLQIATTRFCASLFILMMRMMMIMYMYLTESEKEELEAKQKYLTMLTELMRAGYQCYAEIDEVVKDLHKQFGYKTVNQ